MKKKKWLLALTAAMTGVLVLGLVGCGGGGDDESSDEHGGKNPEEIRREQIETLTGGVFSKADDALLMDSVHYSIRTGNPGNWDTVHLEKGANGFCFYQQDYVSDAKTASIESFSDEITYLTGVELSEETKSIVKKFNPYYFFTKDGSYYLQDKNGATGEIAQSVYEEVLAYVNAFTSNSLSALFNAENFEISEHGTQLLQKQEGELTVNGKAVTEAEWGFGLQEPTFELEMYVGGRFYEMIADYPVGVQEFVDYYMSEVFGDFYTFEFDSFGQVDVEMPQVEKASVKDILDEIIATDTYNLISGNYPSVVENGQGAVYLPGEYNTTRLKADGEKYYAHTGEYNARKKYEITQDMYQSFLLRSSYVYGELFDYDNYTASGDSYAYSGKNFDGTATVDGDKIVLTITQNRVSGLVDCQTITLSHNLQDKAYAQEDGTAQDLPSLTDTEFLQILNKQDRKFEMSCQKDGSEWSEYRRYHFEGNNLAIQRGHVSSYYQVDGDDEYGIHLAGNYRIVKYKENDALDGFNSAKQNCAAALLGERTYITLNSFVCETDDGWVKISKSTYSGLVSYGFVFADGLNVNLYETTSSVNKYTPTHYAKTVAEIQADFASKNYTYADGTATYQVDGENLAQTVAKGYHYYIKGDSGYTKYVKELNANGVFTLTSESTANAVDIVTELVAMANGNLTMTEEGVAIPAWFEWKNDNVTGVDGVNSVAIAIALDGTYTITINDGERVITLSQMGEADVSAPSDDKMTLFAESLAYQNNFTWTVKAIGSQMYESMPEVSALAGATLISATKKADGKKLSYSLTTNNPLANQSAIQTDLRANLNGDSSKLYRYDYTQSQWLGSTRTESFIHSAIAGMQAADIAELLDVNKYTLENGTYTLKSEYTFQWKYDYNISTELMGVKVVVNEDSLVLTATAIVDERFTADVTYTFNGLGSTSVTIPTV